MACALEASPEMQTAGASHVLDKILYALVINFLAGF